MLEDCTGPRQDKLSKLSRLLCCPCLKQQSGMHNHREVSCSCHPFVAGVWNLWESSSWQQWKSFSETRSICSDTTEPAKNIKMCQTRELCISKWCQQKSRQTNGNQSQNAVLSLKLNSSNACLMCFVVCFHADNQFSAMAMAQMYILIRYHW